MADGGPGKYPEDPRQRPRLARIVRNRSANFWNSGMGNHGFHFSGPARRGGPAGILTAWRTGGNVVGITPTVLDQERRLSSRLARMELLERQSQACSARIERSFAGLSSPTQLVARLVGVPEHQRFVVDCEAGAGRAWRAGGDQFKAGRPDQSSGSGSQVSGDKLFLTPDT